jgi:hypothetical protein
MPRFTRLGTAAAVIVAAAAGTVLLTVDDPDGGTHRIPGGPLRDAPIHGWAMTLPEGDVFTDGLESLVITGGRPAVLDSVELVGSDGLEIVGVMLAGPERAINSNYYPDFPPADPKLDPKLVIPAEGATLRPHEEAGWELLLGLKVTKPGPLFREGVRINYTVDGVRYSRVLPEQLAICTSKDQEAHEGCMPPEDHLER